MFKLLNDAPRTREIEQKRRDSKQAVEDYRMQTAAELKRLEGEIQGLPRADPSRRKKEEELARKSTLAEFEVKLRVAQADQTYSDDLEQLYAQVRGTIRQVAVAQGYAIVLMKADEGLNLDRPNEFILSVAMRPVLYADRSIDITDAVTLELSRSGRPPAPAGPVPPPASPSAVPSPTPPTPMPAPSSPGMGG
jgi:Skp family chaperone for outer membrane proteins